MVHGNAIGFGGLDHVPEAFLEEGAVDDNRVSIANQGDLLCRGLEVVRIRADRHDRLDVGEVPNDVLHNVAQNVGGDGNCRCVLTDSGRRHFSLGAAGSSYKAQSSTSSSESSEGFVAHQNSSK